MELVIDFDKIKDPSKREWLINSKYNKELEKGNAEIERGEFTTAADLKAEASKC